MPLRRLRVLMEKRGHAPQAIAFVCTRVLAQNANIDLLGQGYALQATIHACIRMLVQKANIDLLGRE